MRLGPEARTFGKSRRTYENPTMRSTVSHHAFERLNVRYVNLPIAAFRIDDHTAADVFLEPCVDQEVDLTFYS
jgi:hypothetical protein